MNNPPAEGETARFPAGRRLSVFMAVRIRDLPIVEITVRHLPRNLPCRQICLVAPDRECGRIEKALGSGVRVVPENDFIPGLTLERIRSLNVPGFPRGAGWYFQQFLKLQFAFVEPADDFYLIWDADTVPLRPMEFFDSGGRMLLTKAAEFHPPYFETYRRLFGAEPNREFSFIAQHMVVQKSICREMLARIEERVSGAEAWPLKILKTLPPTGNNLFSEYETYGHYVKNEHPDRVRFITRSWFREEATATGVPVPSERQLAALAGQYDYVAFERVNRGWRRLAKLIWGNFLRPVIRRSPQR